MSRLIRNETLTSTAKFSFHDYEREAGRVLESARREAEQIIADARRATEQRLGAERRNGHAEGLELGRRDGREQALREMREAGHNAAVEAAKADVARLEQALRRTLADFEQQKRSLIASAESGLIELSLAIAQRVCKSIAASSSDAVVANVRAALELVQNAHDVTIRLHPQDHALLSEVAAPLFTEATQHQHVALAADATVDRGGCVLASTAGVIDARIATQLDRIAAALCHADVAGPAS